MAQRSVRRVALAAVSLLALVWLYSALTPTPTAPTGTSGLPLLTLSELPAEASQTYELIRAGGPYPHVQDDRVFQNRERILPAAASGFYREYTIPTPDSDDRGARRFVVGQNGTVYYTGDHYDSFVQVRT